MEEIDTNILLNTKHEYKKTTDDLRQLIVSIIKVRNKHVSNRKSFVNFRKYKLIEEISMIWTVLTHFITFKVIDCE